MVCGRCGATGHPYDFYCTACGIFLEAPAPPTSCSDVTPPVGVATTNQVNVTSHHVRIQNNMNELALKCTFVCKQAPASASHDATWQATPSPDPTPKVELTTPTSERYTQTIGLYYPSAFQLQRKEQQRALQVSRQQAARDRQPFLTAISPGRGKTPPTPQLILDTATANCTGTPNNHNEIKTILVGALCLQKGTAETQRDNTEDGSKTNHNESRIDRI